MRSIFILCAIFVHSLAFAQKHFLPGQIETKEGKIINGEINFKDKSPTPKQFEFRESVDGVSQKFLPFQLNSFEVNGKKFISRIVDIDITPQGIHQVNYIESRKTIKDTLFLEVLVNSSISLLYHQDKKYRERFFLQIESSKIIELVKHEYYKDVLDKETHTYSRKLIENNKYKNQLSYYFQSCPSMLEKLEGATLKLPVLKRLVSSYNKCVGNQIKFKQKDKKISVQFGVVAGVVHQTLKLESGAKSLEELSMMELKPSISPSVGASIDVIFPMNQGRWSLNNLFIYNAFDYQSSLFVPTISDNIYDNVDYKISGSYIKLLTKARYTFSKKSVKPFINIGVSYSYLASFQNEMKREMHNYDYVAYDEKPAFEFYKNTEVGLVFGAGLKIGDHYSTEFIFETSDGMSKLSRVGSTFSRLYFLFSYTF